MSSTNTAANVEQRTRVREMLRNVRQHQLDQLSKPAHSTDVASVLQTGVTAASAYAFGDAPAVSSGGNTHALQAGGGARMFTPLEMPSQSSTQLTGKELLVLTVSVLLFAVGFVVIGKCLDSALGSVPLPPPATDTKTNNNNNNNNIQTTLVTKVAVQIVLNVAMIVVPYFVFLKYAPRALVFQYYPIVAALWVVSIHAQPKLRARLNRVLETFTDRSEHEATMQRKRDRQLIAAHTAAAKAKQEVADAARKRNQNPHLHHLQTVHTPSSHHPTLPHHHPSGAYKMSTAPTAFPPPAHNMAVNALPQPATHPSPQREVLVHQQQQQQPNEPQVYATSGTMAPSSFDNSELLSSPMHAAGGHTHAVVDDRTNELPIQFPNSELLGASSGAPIMGSSMLGDFRAEQDIANGMGMGARETYINDLLR